MNKNRSGRKDNPRIKKDVKCPCCSNNKAWTNRGETMPQYSLKCTKCGKVIK